MELTGERDAWLLAALDDVAGLERWANDGVDIVTPRRYGLNPAAGFSELPIHTASALGNVATVRFLLAHGADPDASEARGRGARPLHCAAKLGSREVVDVLLAAGADPRLKDDDREGTASDWARFFGHFELAAFLETVET